MKRFKLLLAIIGLISIIPPLIYYIYFNLIHKLPLSKLPETWAQMGDYLGGILNPVFGVISIFLILHQIQTNKKETEIQIDRLEKNLKLAEFNDVFFKLIEKNNHNYHNNFKCTLTANNHTNDYVGTEAVNVIESLLSSQHIVSKAKAIREFLLNEFEHNNLELKKCDLFSQFRYFYLVVKLIDDTFLNEQETKKKYYHLLIKFTDVNHLRLIIIILQYLCIEYESSKYLITNSSFMNILNELLGNKFQVSLISK